MPPKVKAAKNANVNTNLFMVVCFLLLFNYLFRFVGLSNHGSHCAVSACGCHL